MPRLAESVAAAEATGMRRVWIWLQVIVGWLPVWALYTTLIIAAHTPTRPFAAALVGLHAIITAALLGLVVQRFTRYLVWPHPFRLSFVALHLCAAVVYSASWLALDALLGALVSHAASVASNRLLVPFLVVGVWLYVMVAGVSYAAQATERAVAAEASAARAQLAALRAQLHPHFLFNAMHTVVQLIPRQPERASQAAELVAGVLRTALEEDRDLVPLADEIDFVHRYLAIERIRFGDRLRVEVDIDEDTVALLVPSFAVQTLVENAVQHAAAPRIEATTIRVTSKLSADRSGRLLTLAVRDDGAGASSELLRGRTGSGLSRLRERLSVLFGARALLRTESDAAGGLAATIELRNPT